MTVSKDSITTLQTKAINLPGNDIDTDRIIPARFLKCITFQGLGQYAFIDERLDENGNPKPHPFNEERFAEGEILLVNSNFGCGSSREHAPQALSDYGIRALIGESFAEIFAGNCTAMGIPAVTLEPADLTILSQLVEADPGTEIAIDLVNKTVNAGAHSFKLHLPETYRQALISGTWDTMSTLLSNQKMIKATAQRLAYVNGFQE